MIVCAGARESFDFAEKIGIGLVEASLNLTRICLEKKPSNIVFIGTCGIYEKGEIFGIYHSKHAFNIEFSKFCAGFYSPAFCEINLNSLVKKAPVQILKNVSYETFAVNSSNYICQNSSAAREFAKFGIHFENMEAFAVLSVAKAFEIEAECILCATNFCNESAHEDFLKNHQKAKEKLEFYLRENSYLKRENL